MNMVFQLYTPGGHAIYIDASIFLPNIQKEFSWSSFSL